MALELCLVAHNGKCSLRATKDNGGRLYRMEGAALCVLDQIICTESVRSIEWNRELCLFANVMLAPKMVLTNNQHWKPNHLLSRLDHNRS